MYYTITSEYYATGEGVTRALMIVGAEDKDRALERFKDQYGYWQSIGAVVDEGIVLKDGYERMLTDQAKKYILAIKNKTDECPANFAYSNTIHVNYS